jgi:hypothetical protein
MSLFNFFARDDSQENDPPAEDALVHEDLHACITYFVGADGMPRVDVELRDYEQETLDSFCKLLISLSLDISFFETLDTIKEGLIKEDRLDVFAEIASQIASSVTGNSVEENHTKKSGEEPCISPSEVLQ